MAGRVIEDIFKSKNRIVSNFEIKVNAFYMPLHPRIDILQIASRIKFSRVNPEHLFIIFLSELKEVFQKYE